MSPPPKILEINTWTWLKALSAKYQREISLKTLPFDELEAILQDFHVDYVWFMGVWTRSPASREIACSHPGLIDEFQVAKPDYKGSDVVGSPYAVHAYQVDPKLGGEQGLKQVLKIYLQNLIL